ncbi:MAG: DUF1501 domain-containing protein [Nocardioidaceae bacterium]|nr:DUF1501 domain-containing protein [Nocardioidaceae bacterium]
MTESCSCPDYTLSRRALLRNTGLVSAGAVTTTMFGDTLRQAAYGATPDGNIMVVLSLRGGCDTLSLVVPHADPSYYRARPTIAIPRSQLICEDANFGLHPAFQPLKPLWTSGQMAAVVATGLKVANRSHFSAIEEIEDADLGSEVRSGWINRLIGLDQLRTPLEAVNVGSALQPTSLYGRQPTLSTEHPEDIDLAGPGAADARRQRRRALDQVWGQERGSLAVGARSALATTATLGTTLQNGYRPASGAVYPAGSFGDAMRDTAQMIKARVGIEVITLDHGSWDMHSRLGRSDATSPVSMTGMVTTLAQGLAAFFADLGAEGDRVTLVTLTEFGRRVKENGNQGLDHGWANSTLLMGAGVRGGRYYGTWPGLDDLSEGDLRVTTNYRSVLSEIVSTRFGVSTSQVFPNFSPETVGVMR